MTKPERELPQNVDVEQALLGSVLLNNDVFMRVSAIVMAEHFFEEMHQAIWSTIASLIGKGQVANPILLKTYLGNPELAPGKTLIQYLTSLVTGSTGWANAESYARTIRDLFLRRELIAMSERLAAVAYEAPVEATAETIFADVERDLEALRPAVQKEDDGFCDFGRVESDDIYDAYKREAGVVGLSTGLARLDEILGGLQNSDLIIIAGRPAMGKAQPLDAAIKTLDGWTTMGEVRLGQQLASPDGRPSVVTGIFPQGVKPIFEITFSDGRKTRACGEHLWSVRSRHWATQRVLSTDEVRELLKRKRHQGRLSIDLVSGEFGRIGHLPLDPWLLGMILGNGRVSGSIKLTTRDEENLDRVERFLPTGMCLARKEDGAHSLRQRGDWRCAGHQGVLPNPIVRYLRSVGFSGEGCHTMFVPTEFMTACRADRMALLQGLMDSNGYVEKGASVRFVTTSPQLARDVEALARSLGGLCRIHAKRTWYSHKGEHLEGRTGYVCFIRHADASILFANSKKRQAATRGRNSSVRLTISSIESVGHAEAQCIRVSHPDSLYVTDDYVVTHNTALVTGVGVSVARYIQARNAEGAKMGPVAFFSLEMSRKQLKNRVVADMASVSARKLLRGNGTREEMQAFHDADRELQGLPLTIDQTGALPIASLKLRARALRKRRGLSLIIVDYLQLLTASERKGRDHNRVQEVTEITSGLKALAKELDVPVIALSQLSRKVEERDDKRPMLSDLRESGSIEQDADSVLFVYREEYYLQKAKPREEGDPLGRWYGQMKRWEGIAEIIVAKNRHGGEGVAEIGFEAEFTRFTNEPTWRSPDPEEARKNKVRLSEHGDALRTIIRELSSAVGTRPSIIDLDAIPTLPPNAFLVPTDDVKRVFFETIVADLPNDQERARKLQSAADNLRKNNLTVRFADSSGRTVIYLVELIAE